MGSAFFIYLLHAIGFFQPEENVQEDEECQKKRIKPANVGAF
jgi:hypothetical protein